MDLEGRYLANHHGVVCRTEARSELRLSNRQIDWRVTSGRWERIGPAMYRLAGAPPTWLGSARALALSTGGYISHSAAARVWGLEGFGRASLEVTVAVGVRRGAASGVRWHRSTQMHLAAATERRAVPVTGIARTVLDVAGVIPRRRLDEVIDEVLRRRMLSWPDLHEVLVRHARRGRRGVGALRALLVERFGDQAIPDSRWNRMVWQLLVDAGLPEPRPEFEVRDAAGRFAGRLDLAYPHARLGVELDSKRHHLNSHSFVADRRRANRLVNAGWRLLHFTWDSYADRPHELVSTVREALRTVPTNVAR
ncbi:MAG: hypothetical protein AAF567_12740 [Actinomycetota bacterium]